MILGVFRRTTAHQFRFRVGTIFKNRYQFSIYKNHNKNGEKKMGLDDDYKDFRVYRPQDGGEGEEYDELDVEQDNVEELFTSEGVYLLVRYDLRRIFIWKGPRSPVRKRFMSSRVGKNIQDKSSKIGMHMKIVSVDAGDEPREFLRAFNVKPYEVQEDERLADMYYVRNSEREKIEDAKMAAEELNANGKKEEYWSPLLEEEKRREKMEKAKQKAASTVQEIATSISPKTKKKKDKAKAPPRVIPKPKKKEKIVQPATFDEEKEVMDLILSHDCPENHKRMNIVIGKSLYSVKRVIATLFGKEVEEEQWDRVKTIPDANIELTPNFIRIYCKDNEIKGIEMFSAEKETETTAPPKKAKTTPAKKVTPKKKKSTKRTLKKVPQG